ncbi:MAG TPA: monofunctional biosynthetic peptidoglycan transglycosylase [Gemmatimonadaceae bacterium]|nr:monofunctional biosynthetic peptidoglycan transglycosylase [Gemmatimonadaceae bacterium]
MSYDLIGIQVQQPTGPEAAPAPSRARRVAARAGKVVLALLAGYYVLCVVLLVIYRFANPPITGVQLERRIEAMRSDDDYRMRKRVVAYERLPRHVPRAVMAAEDGRFLTHWGFDLKEMRNAGSAVFDGEMPRGASTITQQLMKNLFGCTCRNPVRKLYDFALTPPAELILGKQRILELYLNNVEWGRGIFGIEAAARHHYGTSARRLSRAQAAGLAALLPNPRKRTPDNTPEYRSEILRRMAHRGW